MKLVKGKTLSALLSERESPDQDQAKLLGIFEQVCQTMAYAHSRSVIHRDLKPANIMVGAFGEVQVMDWGLAKVLQTGGIADETRAAQKPKDMSVIETVRSSGSATFGGVSVGSQTCAGSVMGTPAYMSPEQAAGDAELLDARADVFGLGAILCEILTGQPPYVADDGRELLRMAARGDLENCQQRLKNCSAHPELVELTQRCLASDPGKRFKDAGSVADRINRTSGVRHEETWTGRSSQKVDVRRCGFARTAGFRFGVVVEFGFRLRRARLPFKSPSLNSNARTNRKPPTTNCSKLSTPHKYNSPVRTWRVAELLSPTIRSNLYDLRTVRKIDVGLSGIT